MVRIHMIAWSSALYTGRQLPLNTALSASCAAALISGAEVSRQLQRISCSGPAYQRINCGGSAYHGADGAPRQHQQSALPTRSEDMLQFTAVLASVHRPTQLARQHREPGEKKSLSRLEISGEFQSLPESLGSLTSLQHLILTDCHYLTALPDSF